MNENLKDSNDNVRIAQSKFYWAVELPSKEHHEMALHVIINKCVLEIGC